MGFKDKQTGCTEEHPVRTRWCCNSIEPLVRSNAFRTELLSDPVTVDSSSLPYHVYVDVYRSYRIALQDEEVEPSVPYR